MLKNQRLLYILPEMAFTASVGETPKEDYFFVQSFHQINGEFMKDENFLFENLKKLFERVDEETYTLVLPDFLFTDTIINVPEIDDLKIAEHLRDQLLPRIEVSTFSHETRTSVLLQRKKTAKVQLSAFEKELAATLKLAIGSRQVVIDEVVPLSWTLKAAVSLEPSITIAQLGERLYLAEHYIGINQTINAPLTDLMVVAETVKTLKGADPNLQTAYLLTSILVEEKLKNLLTKTLPVQQLTEPSEEEAKIPSYVKQIIEVSARTLSLVEFVVPRFSLVVDQTLMKPKPQPQPTAAPAALVVENVETVASEPVSEPDTAAPETKSVTKPEPQAIPEPEAEPEPEPEADSEPESTPVATPAPAAEAAPMAPAKIDIDAALEQLEAVGTTLSVATVASAATAVTAGALDAPTAEVELPAAPAVAKVAAPETAVYLPQKKKLPAIETKPAPALTPSRPAANKVPPSEPPLSFMRPKTTEIEAATATGSSRAAATKIATPVAQKDDRIEPKDENNTVKKKGGMGAFFKKLFLFILIFVITIALGIAVGIGILTLTGENPFQSAEQTPTPTPLATPELEPTPEPEAPAATDAATPTEPEEKLDLAAIKVLVVNATGVGGLAGQTKTALEKGEFTGVQTGNAKGTYEGNADLVLMSEKNTAIISALEEASGLSLTFDEDVSTEDKDSVYDAVIVLLKK